jgi:hypothetical protein
MVIVYISNVVEDLMCHDNFPFWLAFISRRFASALDSPPADDMPDVAEMQASKACWIFVNLGSGR